MKEKIKNWIKNNWKQVFSITLLVLVMSSFVLTSNDINAAVRVKGYYRKDGTYVSSHYRSNPDGNPYNNWSYPGNVNPYTGKIAPGNPTTYLKNYNNTLPVSSPSSQNQFLVNNLTSLSSNVLIRRKSGIKVYKVIDGKKYWIPTAKRFELFGYKWSDIKIVADDFTNDSNDGILTYAKGTLVKSSIHPFVWLIKDNSTKKWITTAINFEKCNFKWYNIRIIPEEEIQSLSWSGNNTNGNVTYPLCN